MRILAASIVFLLFNFSGFSQSEELAKAYFEQGEFEKALRTYQKLAKENPNIPIFFNGMIASYQQLEKYKEAEGLLREKLNSSANQPNFLVELGHNFELQENIEEANLYYTEALNAIESRPNFAFSIARTFEKYSLLDRAVQAYEIGMKLNPDVNFHIQLARLYGEQGEIKKMFTNYIDLIGRNPDYLPSVSRMYGKFITENPQNEANVIFRKLLLKKLQQEQDILFNEMLSWLFVQQKEFKKAFLQEKAIFRRGNGNLGRIIQLSLMARDNQDYEIALEILDFLINESKNESLKLQAHQIQLSIQQKMQGRKQSDQIEKSYRELFSTYGKGLNTLALQLDYANFLAFKQDKKKVGAEVLNDLLELQPNKFQEAAIKMALADILVLDEKFNQALIYYSQVQNMVENDVLAQTARFKVAKTSYYKGDFEWAKKQLDVLKSATSQLIANDAMELSLLIKDNTLEDSTQTGLKQYAKADLLAFQNKNKEAIQVLEDILINHKGKKIEDEALYKQAELYEKMEEFSKAEANYLKLIQYHKNSILADNAHYSLAELYANELHQSEKAQGFYEKIVFNYADSIYFVEARKKYRELRGDAVE